VSGQAPQGLVKSRAARHLSHRFVGMLLLLPGITQPCLTVKRAAADAAAGANQRKGTLRCIQLLSAAAGAAAAAAAACTLSQGSRGFHSCNGAAVRVAWQ